MTWTAVWCEASGEWDRLSGGDQVLPKGLKAHLSPGGSVALGSVFSHAIRRLVKVPKCGAVCYRQKHLREQNLALPALQISELLFTVVMNMTVISPFWFRNIPAASSGSLAQDSFLLVA